jgi:hypothetical protein
MAVLTPAVTLRPPACIRVDIGGKVDVKTTDFGKVFGDFDTLDKFTALTALTVLQSRNRVSTVHGTVSTHNPLPPFVEPHVKSSHILYRRVLLRVQLV